MGVAKYSHICCIVWLDLGALYFLDKVSRYNPTAVLGVIFRFS